MKSNRRLIGLYFIAGILGASIVFLATDSTQSTASFLCGAFVGGLNLVLLSIGWRMILRKKLVALAISVIVIKYAFVAALIYYLLRQPWMEPIYFVVGLSVILPTALMNLVRRHGV